MERAGYDGRQLVVTSLASVSLSSAEAGSPLRLSHRHIIYPDDAVCWLALALASLAYVAQPARNQLQVVAHAPHSAGARRSVV